MQVRNALRALAFSLPILTLAPLCAQEGSTPPPRIGSLTSGVGAPGLAPEADLEYVCPMDADIRSKAPGVCPRCGMKLVRGIAETSEYPVRITTQPARLNAGRDVRLDFRVQDPKTLTPVRDFEIVHEKLYHLFVISQDLQFFVHEHPQLRPDGSFQLQLRFPKPGLYRVLNDFYPALGTPQLIERTLLVEGEGFQLAFARINADTAPKHTENLDVELALDPPRPVAGMKTLLFFRLTPKDGIEPLLGAMGHMLAASSDLIDMIHTHPFQVTDYKDGAAEQIQFNVIFPRQGVYRVWVQFQRKGVVNTAAFNVPVGQLE